MILKLYLIISIITYAIYWLTIISLINTAKRTNHKRTAKKVDVAGTVLIWLKFLVLCFTPLVNLIYLYTFLFKQDQIQSGAKKYLEESEGGVSNE